MLLSARIAVAVSILAAAGRLSHAQTAPEQTLLHLANADRARDTLPALTWSPTLAAAARSHALELARHPGQLEHQLPSEPDLVARAAIAGARFSTVSENLAAANVSLPEVEAGWLRSPTHRHNLLNPTLDQVGIAVVPAHGLLYIVEDFARASPALSLQAIERSVAHSLLERGLSLASLSDTARAACRTGNTAPQDPTRGTPRSVLQWDGPDPTLLPAELLQAITSLHPRTALLGACPGQQPPFTTYRVTVLLF